MMPDMKKLLKEMKEIPADIVIIEGEKRIVIENPKVVHISVMGQETFQIIGKPREEEKEQFSEEDVKFVMERTGASEEDVKVALIRSEGDIAKAILALKG